MSPNQTDLYLHAISMLLATAIHDAFQHLKDENVKEDLLTAYRCVRRHISVNPETGKRYGAEDASNATRGKLD